MSKEKKSVEPEQPAATPKRYPRKGRSLNVWISDDLRAAIDDACKTNRRLINEEVSIALERYCESLGLWPRKGKKQ